MASYGFQLLGEASGNVAISQDFTNLALRLKTNIRTSSDRGGGSYAYRFGYWINRFPLKRSNQTIVAFRSSGYAFVYVYEPDHVVFASEEPGESIDVFVFDAVSQSSVFENTNYGMIVYRSDGSVAFDSRYKYMKVVGSVAVNNNISNPTAVPGVIASLKSVAVVQSYAYVEHRSPVRTAPTSPPRVIGNDTTLTFWAVKSDASSTDFKQVETYTPDGRTSGYGFGPGDNLLFVDVSLF